jgi:hypothetical protein
MKPMTLMTVISHMTRIMLRPAWRIVFETISERFNSEKQWIRPTMRTVQ